MVSVVLSIVMGISIMLVGTATTTLLVGKVVPTNLVGTAVPTNLSGQTTIYNSAICNINFQHQYSIDLNVKLLYSMKMNLLLLVP